MDAVALNALWIIPLIMLAIVGAFYLLVRTWRIKANQEARLLPGELRSLEKQYRQLEGVLQGYALDDAEPYGAPLRELRMQLDSSEQQYELLRQQYVRIQELLPRKGSLPFSAIVGMPGLLYNLRKEIASLRKGVTETQATLHKAESLSASLNGLSWEVASQVRQADQRQEQIGQQLELLRQRHVGGAALRAAEQQETSLRSRLDELPAYLTSGDESAVRQQADKAAVIKAYQVVQYVTPEQDELAERLESWGRQVEAVEHKLGRLRREVSAVEATLASMPEGLDLTAHQARLDELNASLQTLQAGLARLDIDGLSDLARDADHVQEAAQVLDGELKQARGQAAALDQLLPQLTTGLAQVSGLVSGLGTAKEVPLRWGQTSAALARLSQQVNSLTKIAKNRSLEQVDHDLGQANQLYLELKEVLEYCQQVSSQHSELVELMRGPEIGQGELWRQSSLKLVGRLKEYNAENWLRADAVGSLPGKLDSLGEGLRRLQAGGTTAAIPEDQVGSRLTEARRLVQLSQALRVRVNQVEGRLAELQHTENQAREQLERAKNILVQVGYVVHSNPLLSSLAAQEIEHQQSQIDRYTAELNQRQHGTVEGKARQASGFVLHTENTLNGWLVRLDQDTQAKGKALTGTLTRLDSIARLEDAPVAETRRLLSSPELRSGGMLAAGKAQYPLEEMVPEFKRRSDIHQSAAATQAAVQDLEKPVVDSYNAASQNRQHVLDQFGQVSTWLRQTRAWPPVSVDLDAEQHDLAGLENQWQGLKDKPIKAIDLVARLGELSTKYQSLGERVRQAAEKGTREQDQAETLENELRDYARQWERLLGAYRDNSMATQEIQQLLSQVDDELYRLRQGYREGTVNYNQAVQTLQSLHRRTRLFQAALDDSHVIDMSGKVITSRTSTRAPGEW